MTLRLTDATGQASNWFTTISNNTIQYNTIQYNTIQYNTIQYSTIQYSTVHYISLQCLSLNKGCCGLALAEYSMYIMSLPRDIVVIDPAFLSKPRPLLCPPPDVGKTSSSASLSEAAKT